ncbi:hypothetical protein JJ685_11095 [Ramlibacter monticola]|uniref:Uncharacterized protein n=1 Tax=Ramlibacter monticola TaxID=1926872 RepID=A0A937CSY1_9BURK|nr:hypothetical protein [Ramlibacter monticola]MBL0391681.1 hypothetical protein [Ramlibacter monticola]
MAGSSGSAPGSMSRPAPGHEIEVVEKNTDTSWALFQALLNEQERGFGKTEPAELQSANPAAASPSLAIDTVLQEARRNNRVCPQPLAWQRLYDWLPNKTPQLGKVPASRAEWDHMPALEKRIRLCEHIEWAAAQGVLHQVHEALRKLPEDRWHHIGE